MSWPFNRSGDIHLEILEGLELIVAQAQAGMQECLVVFARSVEVLHQPPKARAIEVQERDPNVAPSWRDNLAADHSTNLSAMAFERLFRLAQDTRLTQSRVNEAGPLAHDLLFLN